MKKRYTYRCLTKHYGKSTKEKAVYAWSYGGKIESVEAAEKYYKSYEGSDLVAGIEVKDTITKEIVFKDTKEVEIVKI